MKSATPFHTIIKSLLSLIITVWAVALFFVILICILYAWHPTCGAFIGSDQWTCRSIGEYMHDISTMIILVTWIPFFSICLYPFSWVTIDAVSTYRASHKKPIFPDMRKKFFRLVFSLIVSIIVSFIIISFYNSYLIDTLHLIEGWIFSSLIFLIWPLSYYWTYQWITKKVTKIQ